jgi:hypothetical protein
VSGEERQAFVTNTSTGQTLTNGGKAVGVEFKNGDHASWNSEAGRVSGTTQKKVAKPTKFKGDMVDGVPYATKLPIRSMRLLGNAAEFRMRASAESF